MSYFLGVDIGGSKSHAMLADATGRVLGFGHAGARANDCNSASDDGKPRPALRPSS